LRKLKSTLSPLVVELETTKAGLIGTVKVVVVSVVGTVAGAGGFTAVLTTTSCGLVRVIDNWS
jgi:hypothetical protein